jgi:serine/threonine protein kinase
VDWWALGIVMYAMLAGRLPFRDTDEYRLHQKIRCQEVEYPEWISLEAILIVTKASIINITTEALQVLEWGYHVLSLFHGHFFFLGPENFCPVGFLKIFSDCPGLLTICCFLKCSHIIVVMKCKNFILRKCVIVILYYHCLCLCQKKT